MIFLRLLCAVVDAPFGPFSELNKQSKDSDYNNILYEIVKFGEIENMNRELSILMPLLTKEPAQRTTPEKLYSSIQSDYL